MKCISLKEKTEWSTSSHKYLGEKPSVTWKLSSKQVHLLPDVFNWFCTSTSKECQSVSVGHGWKGRGFGRLVLQTWSNSHLLATPTIPANTISIHGNAIDLLYHWVDTWGIENEIIKLSLLYLCTTSTDEKCANCLALGAIYSGKTSSNTSVHCWIDPCN